MHNFIELLLILVIGNSLHFKELLSAFLIKFLLDIIDSKVDWGNDEEFEGVHTAIGDLDDLVEGHELGMQDHDLDQAHK